ncbi:hypothetical protein [Streptomyces zaomyceticus]
MPYGGTFLTAGVLLPAIVHTLGTYALQQRGDPRSLSFPAAPSI